MGAFSFV